MILSFDPSPSDHQPSSPAKFLTAGWHVPGNFPGLVNSCHLQLFFDGDRPNCSADFISSSLSLSILLSFICLTIKQWSSWISDAEMKSKECCQMWKGLELPDIWLNHWDSNRLITGYCLDNQNSIWSPWVIVFVCAPTWSTAVQIVTSNPTKWHVNFLFESHTQPRYF